MAASSRFRALFWTCGLLFIGLIGIQFARPALTSPPVTADLQAPPEVKQILRTSCYDCHSNQTRLAWFDQIVPVYWMVAKDVKQGRERLNFSEIAKLPAGQQKGILYESVNQIQLGAMPLPVYVRAHPESAITPEQLTVLRNYLDPPGSKQSTAADIGGSDAQYDAWIHGASPTEVRPAPNGIAFIPDYKNWRPISSTDRFDNGTLREILGNDVAIKAIEENRINPWPDGTAFAKIAWLAQPDENGIVHSGAFFQVEFMIRDSKKYTATKGWGWARWRGTDLKPYGTDAAFTDECIGCHAPVSRNDYVYTAPIARAK